MRSLLTRLLTVGLVAAVAVVGSLAGRAIWDSVTAEDEPKAEPPPREALDQEATATKFEGELLGFFVGPPQARVPDKFVTYEELCGTQTTEQVGWDRAGVYDLRVTLPDSFTPATESLNTGVIACGETVYAVRWEYLFSQPNGYPGSLVISRSLFKYTEMDVSTGRVTTTEIGDRPAILVSPISNSGIGSAAAVIFPGDEVTTLISSSGVPLDDLQKVAEIVATAVADES